MTEPSPGGLGAVGTGHLLGWRGAKGLLVRSVENGTAISEGPWRVSPVPMFPSLG